MRHRNGARLLFCAAALCAFGGPSVTSAQRLEAFPVEAALDTRSFSEMSPVSFAPDGKWLAYIVRSNQRMQSKQDNGIERERYVRTGVSLQNEASDVWIANTETGETRNLTGGQGANWDPAWSPDGRYLGFLSDRGGGEQARLWVWDSTSDRLRLTAGVCVRSSYPAPGIQWAPDSRHIVITIVPEKMTVDEYVERTIAPARETYRSRDATVLLYTSPSEGSKRATSTRPWRANLDAYSFAELVWVDIASGQVRAISSGDRVGWYAVSPDGLRVAYAVPKRLDAAGRFRKVYDLISVDLSSRREHRLVSDGLLADAFAWALDGSFVTYAIYDAEGEGAEVLVVAPAGGEPREIARLPRSPGRFSVPLWDPSGRYLFVLAGGTLWRISVSDRTPKELAIPERRIVRRVGQSNGILWSPDGARSMVVLAHDPAGRQDGFYRIALETGESAKLLEDGRCFECNVLGAGVGLRIVAAAGPSVAYVAEDARHAPDLWVSDIHFLHPRRLTHLNPQFEQYQMGSPQLFDWLSEDGKRTQGALLLPPDYQKGRRYPLVVYVYPTLLSNNVNEFALGEYPGPFNLQLFATRGYAVLLPDAAKNVDKGMNSLSASVLPGITKAVELGIADPERIGIMGHSDGGYATLALITQTRRFKAAVAAAGFADYTGLFGQLDKDGISWSADEVETDLGAAPWDRPLRYVENSPVYYLDRIATPLLLVHGTNDGAVGSALADQVFVGMRRLGKEVEYAKYRGESHVPRDWSHANQVDLCHRILDWFAGHLMAEPEPRQVP